MIGIRLARDNERPWHSSHDGGFKNPPGRPTLRRVKANFLKRTIVANHKVIATSLLILAIAAGSTLYAQSLPPPPGSETQTAPDEPSDAEIRDIIVKESIERYTGSCACPYHRKWNEKLFRFPNQFRDHPTVRCGDDSEYVRPGGPTVFCYPYDVPPEMVEAYREHLRSTFLTEPQPKF